MSIYITGDTHGDLVSRFSYHRHPELRSWTKDDVVFVLGDVGVPWYNTAKYDTYHLDFCASKPPTFIFILGNHENYDEIEKMPTVEKFGGKLLQCTFNDKTYDNIFYVKDLTILDIEDEHILCISHAESHDIWNLLDPQDPEFQSKRKKMNNTRLFYRVKGQSWWPQEKMDVSKTQSLLAPHLNDHFTLILSHDYPKAIIGFYYTTLGLPTEGQRFLDKVRRTVDFDGWLHGHLHDEHAPWQRVDNRIACLYKSIVKVS